MKVKLRKYLNRKKDKFWWRLDFSPKIRDPKTGKLYRFKSLGEFTYLKPKNIAEKEWNNEMKHILRHKMKILSLSNQRKMKRISLNIIKL